MGQGKAIDAVASPNVKVITVGNPCNTNALIASANAASIPSRQFTAMTRLDQNRAVGQIAEQAGVPASKVEDVFIWGNHSNTMYPIQGLQGQVMSPLLIYSIMNGYKVPS